MDYHAQYALLHQRHLQTHKKPYVLSCNTAFYQLAPHLCCCMGSLYPRKTCHLLLFNFMKFLLATSPDHRHPIQLALVSSISNAPPQFSSIHKLAQSALLTWKRG